jgi:hypothetical protein
MTSPSPTQPPPTQTAEPKAIVMTEYRLAERKSAEYKEIRATPIRRRMGETKTAQIIKGILRPPFKVLYYLSTWIRKHKLASLGILLLLVISISATSYAVTDELPFGINHNPFNFPYNGGKGEGNLVESWVYALREGKANDLQIYEQNIPQGQTPDPSQLASFSKAHFTWDDVSVLAVHQQSDSTIDSLVQVTLTTKNPGANVTGVLLLHFVTASISDGQNTVNVLLGIDVLPLRPLQS